MACLAPELAVKIYATAAKDSALAHALQNEFSSLAAGIGVRYGIAGIKAALDLCGYAGGGDVRPPLETLGEVERDEIKRCLEDCGIMSAAVSALPRQAKNLRWMPISREQ